MSMNCIKCSTEIDEAANKSGQIDALLREERKKTLLQSKSIVLMLGGSQSGKTTVLKQIRLEYTKGGFQAEELNIFRKIINQNIVQIVKEILNATRNLIPESDTTEAFRAAREIIDNYPDKYYVLDLHPDLQKNILIVWTSHEAQAVMKGSEAQTVLDSANYWFPNELARIFKSDYVPTETDIMYARSGTKGIHEYDFQTPSMMMRVIDVGGQRTHRNKWLCLFSSATSVIFVVPANGYYRKVPEDTSLTQLADSLALFDNLLHTSNLAHASFIMFINKIDLLQNALNNYKFENYYPDFTGNSLDCDQVLAFMISKFKELDDGAKKRKIYVHYTCAVDKSQLRKVLVNVDSTISESLMKSVGLM